MPRRRASAGEVVVVTGCWAAAGWDEGVVVTAPVEEGVVTEAALGEIIPAACRAARSAARFAILSSASFLIRSAASLACRSSSSSSSLLVNTSLGGALGAGGLEEAPPLRSSSMAR